MVSKDSLRDQLTLKTGSVITDKMMNTQINEPCVWFNEYIHAWPGLRNWVRYAVSGKDTIV